MSDGAPEDPKLLCKSLYVRGLSQMKVVRALRDAGVPAEQAAHLAATHAPPVDRAALNYRRGMRGLGILLVLAGLVPLVGPFAHGGAPLQAITFCLVLGLCLIIFPEKTL